MEKAQKTFKREYAILLMFFVLGLLLWGLVVERSDITDVGKFLVYPVLLFNAAAFGLDSAAKQFALR